MTLIAVRLRVHASVASARMTSNGLAPLSLAVSMVVRTSASAFAAFAAQIARYVF
jgi:hypothetical protein